MTAEHRRIFISAAEPSADLHAASLIRATLERSPNTTFVGIAGPKMREAGCTGLFDLSSGAAMLMGTWGVARRGMQALREATRFLKLGVDALVVLDSPVLNLRLAKRSHRLGIPVLYYIAPQTWAWGEGRIRHLRRFVTQLAVILPFEEDYFRSRGLDAIFVGHPLGDRLSEDHMELEPTIPISALNRPVVALLPGSRGHVVREIVDGQLEVAGKIREVIPATTFLISAANSTVTPIVRDRTERSGLRALILEGPARRVIEAADLVLVASGTAALEVALLERPMIVMYNVSRWLYHLVGRWVVRTPHLSLPNILAGRKIVPEFMPYYRSIDPIAESAIGLLRSPSERERMVKELSLATGALKVPGAASRTAGLLLNLASTARGSDPVTQPCGGPDRD